MQPLEPLVSVFKQLVVCLYVLGLHRSEVLDRQRQELALGLRADTELVLEAILVVQPVLDGHLEVWLLERVVTEHRADDVDDTEEAALRKIHVLHLVVLLGQGEAALTLLQEVDASDLAVLVADGR